MYLLQNFRKTFFAQITYLENVRLISRASLMTKKKHTIIIGSLCKIMCWTEEVVNYKLAFADLQLINLFIETLLEETQNCI